MRLRDVIKHEFDFLGPFTRATVTQLAAAGVVISRPPTEGSKAPDEGLQGIHSDLRDNPRQDITVYPQLNGKLER